MTHGAILRRKEAIRAATAAMPPTLSPQQIVKRLRDERAALVKRIAEIDAVLKKMEETP